MVLESARGTPVNEIAQKLDTYPNKVIMWGNRYQDKGLLGLKDKPRKGRPLRYKGLREKLLKKINEPVPRGYSRWDAALLSKALDTSSHAIWRVLRKEGISLSRQQLLVYHLQLKQLILLVFI